jgi:hypothetical protein
MNACEQYQIQVDDVPVHFMRKPGVGPNPTPLILPRERPIVCVGSVRNPV